MHAAENNVTNTTLSEEDTNQLRTNYIITYAVLMAVATYVYVHRTFAFFLMCMRASIKLHDKLFRGITRATMYFYNNNPSGRILNRFSRDISNIDTLLPPSLNDCISVSCCFLCLFDGLSNHRIFFAVLSGILCHNGHRGDCKLLAADSDIRYDDFLLHAALCVHQHRSKH